MEPIFKKIIRIIVFMLVTVVTIFLLILLTGRLLFWYKDVENILPFIFFICLGIALFVATIVDMRIARLLKDNISGEGPEDIDDGDWDCDGD